jgi:hypothetical protein
VGGLRQLPRATVPGQRVETGMQIASGVLSLLVVLTHYRWRRWGTAVGTVCWHDGDTGGEVSPDPPTAPDPGARIDPD